MATLPANAAGEVRLTLRIPNGDGTDSPAVGYAWLYPNLRPGTMYRASNVDPQVATRTLVEFDTSGNLEDPETGTWAKVLASDAPGASFAGMQWVLEFHLENVKIQPATRFFTVPAGSFTNVGLLADTSPQPSTQVVYLDALSGDISALSAQVSDVAADMDAVDARIEALPTARTSSAGHAAKLATKLEQGIENAVLAVVGDSTANATDEWFYLLGQSLATTYPAYTVRHRLWNDTNQNYDAATTIQTGTGGVTLDLYNASTPGMGPQYSTPRLVQQLPVEPDLVFVNYGHNLSFDAVTFVRDYYLPLVDGISIRWPNARIICSSQNKRVSPATNLTLHPVYMARIKDICAERGFGYLPAWEAFDEAGAVALTNSDGFHPNTAGSLLWADLAVSIFKSAPVINPQARRPLPNTSVFIPATAIAAINKNGTYPLYGASNDLPAWKFDKTTGVTQSLGAWADLPADWKTVNIKVLWAAESTAAGSIRLRCQVLPWAIGSVSARDTSTWVNAPSPGVSGQVVSTTLRAAFTLPTSRIGLFLLREFADAADTLTGTSAVHGFVVEKVS